MNTGLLLLLVGLPPTPSSLRVRVWRRLRALCAAPLKRSAYLLPDNADRCEDFQWLAQEIQREGGEATLIDHFKDAVFEQNRFDGHVNLQMRDP